MLQPLQLLDLVQAVRYHPTFPLPISLTPPLLPFSPSTFISSISSLIIFHQLLAVPSKLRLAFIFYHQHL